MSQSISLRVLSGALFLAATSLSGVSHAQQPENEDECNAEYSGWLCPWAEVTGGQGDGGDGQGGGQGGGQGSGQGGGPQGGGPQGGGPQGGGPQGSGGED